MHGGEIAAHNQPGVARCFGFTLPVADYTEPEADE